VTITHYARFARIYVTLNISYQGICISGIMYNVCTTQHNNA